MISFYVSNLFFRRGMCPSDRFGLRATLLFFQARATVTPFPVASCELFPIPKMTRAPAHQTIQATAENYLSWAMLAELPRRERETLVPALAQTRKRLVDRLEAPWAGARWQLPRLALRWQSIGCAV